MGPLRLLSSGGPTECRDSGHAARLPGAPAPIGPTPGAIFPLQPAGSYRFDSRMSTEMQPPDCRFCNIGQIIASSDVKTDYMSARMRCNHCGAGFKDLFRRTGIREMTASIQIYRGAVRQPRLDVDPRLVAWAMGAFDGTVQEMEADGLLTLRLRPA